MGLSDRDYMHERGGRRVDARGRTLAWSDPRSGEPPWRRIVAWTLAVCALVLAAGLLWVRPVGAVAFPPSGAVMWYSPVPAEADSAPLTTRAPGHGAAFHAVLLREVETQRLVALVPIHRGDTAQLRVGFGRYEMVLASGDPWYGPQKLFGRLGDRRQTRDPLHFYRQGDHSVGHRIDLAGRFDGNLPTRALRPWEQ